MIEIFQEKYKKHSKNEDLDEFVKGIEKLTLEDIQESKYRSKS